VIEVGLAGTIGLSVPSLIFWRDWPALRQTQSQETWPSSISNESKKQHITKNTPPNRMFPKNIENYSTRTEFMVQVLFGGFMKRQAVYRSTS